MFRPGTRFAVLLVVLLLCSSVWCVTVLQSYHEDAPQPASARLTSVELGTPLPQITVYDEAGRPFDFSSLQGSYSVVTFGCLT